MIRRLSIPVAILALALAAADDETRRQRSFTMIYEASARDVPADAKQVRLWVPVPQDTGDQKISNVRVALTTGGETVNASLDDLGKLDAVGGTPVKCTVARIEEGWGRSLCVETPGKPIRLRLRFDCTRYETRGGDAATEEERQQALKPNAMIPLGGKVSAVAKGLAPGASPMETGRILYDHTLERMRYDKPAGSGWGHGDSEWACDSRHGNCTDFHSYFIALARTHGIPAIFEMGFPVPAGDAKETAVGGYHCWAYFHVDGKGWVPVDISEADKHPEKASYFFRALDENRVTMTRGRDLLLTPRPAAGALNFFVYPHLEIDGKDCSKSNIEKAFKRINK